MTPYQQLKQASQATGLPKAYRTDLTVHDLQYLKKRHRPERFGYLLREHGTHILLNCEWSRAVIGRYRDARCGEETQWYWFDGEHLRNTSPEYILMRLAEEPEVTREAYPGLFVN